MIEQAKHIRIDFLGRIFAWDLKREAVTPSRCCDSVIMGACLTEESAEGSDPQARSVH